MNRILVIIGVFIISIGNLFASPSTAPRLNNPIHFSASVASALYYTIPAAMRFQAGPEFSGKLSLRDNNHLGLRIEHLYWESLAISPHTGFRSVQCGIQWYRAYAKLQWGMEYILSFNRNYRISPGTTTVSSSYTTGFAGLGIQLSYLIHSLQLHADIRFSNSAGFKLDSTLITSFNVSATLHLCSWAAISVSYKLRHKNDFSPFSQLTLTNSELSTRLEHERLQSLVITAMQFEYRGVHLKFGPALSLNPSANNYANRIILSGDIGYTFYKRKQR